MISKIENFIRKYVVLNDPAVALPLALWATGTHLFTEFDCYPYLVISSAVKRSGKTRLAEVLAFLSSNSRRFSAMTGPAFFRSLKDERPTIFCDEAESLSGESASLMRAVLNVGYRKGQSIPRLVGKKIVEFPAYSPKVFILIGDVYDTLRDRSIIVTMKRGSPEARFDFKTAGKEGEELQDEIAEEVKSNGSFVKVGLHYGGKEFALSEFLSDREEELWLPLFILMRILCPKRQDELKRIAVDMATEKTAPARSYVNLLGAEREAEDDEYAGRLLSDVLAMVGKDQKMFGTKLLGLLREIPLAPWRKFRGEGLTLNSLASMLARFGIKPRVVRIGKQVQRGYRSKDIKKGIKSL